MKIKLFVPLTAAFLLALVAPVHADNAASGVATVPIAVAESDLFEAVGRLQPEGLVWFVDRAESNVPVLAASLEVEAGGKAVPAVFRPERGDYLIADAAWLAPLRQPGEHALALTLIAGEESDVLTAELVVQAAESSLAAAGRGAWFAGAAALALLAAGVWWRSAGRAARRQKAGGVA